jgi:hypothetical protein
MKAVIAIAIMLLPGASLAQTTIRPLPFNQGYSVQQTGPNGYEYGTIRPLPFNQGYQYQDNGTGGLIAGRRVRCQGYQNGNVHRRCTVSSA